MMLSLDDRKKTVACLIPKRDQTHLLDASPNASQTLHGGCTARAYHVGRARRAAVASRACRRAGTPVETRQTSRHLASASSSAADASFRERCDVIAASAAGGSFSVQQAAPAGIACACRGVTADGRQGTTVCCTSARLRQRGGSFLRCGIRRRAMQLRCRRSKRSSTHPGCVLGAATFAACMRGAALGRRVRDSGGVA